jgi:F-type H+-transporting ATPase subunit epsilon
LVTAFGEAARRRAQESLEQAQSNAERAELIGALERAMSRIRVAELSRRHSGRRIETPRLEQ